MSAVDPSTAGDCRLVEQFVFDTRGQSSSALSLWQRLRWLQTHLGAPFALDPASRPVVVSREAGCKQATVVEPEMLLFLREALSAYPKGHELQISCASMLCIVHVGSVFSICKGRDRSSGHLPLLGLGVPGASAGKAARGQGLTGACRARL